MLHITAEHPVYSPSTRRCHPAGELQTGQVLLRLTRTGAVPSPQLDRTTLREALVALPTAETVYNLRVATYQNYFADGVLVHNKSPIIPPGGITLPDCLDGQALTVTADRTVRCTQVVTGAVEPPDCSQKSDQALNGNDGSLVCVPKGIGGTGASLAESINRAALDTDLIETTLGQITSSRTTAKYCGLYAATPNPNGAITGGNRITGLAGAANLCQLVTGCSPSAHMCTVYELYESAAANSLPSNIPQAWVHMQSWQHNTPGQIPPAAA